ncbi:hypothetical protein MWN34_01900 [Ancylobacter sp. 6x-1]|uniref:Uncharacterized protein n=1 Tax=Ancylobacter crimeensis TaxID=2579147 RepID=A0ABT0D6T1_9HYPH|nr:hypothetical protein [Ancylobacter crimeensis]MCK0195658.1 hypothetical protein [Ancylobacter crimeensis]
MNHMSLALIAVGCLLLVFAAVWWRRRSSEAPVVKVDVRGTGVSGWWTLVADMDGSSDRGWDATEIHVTKPDEAKIIGVNEALGTGHGGGTTVFDEIDPDRISNRSAWSVADDNADIRRPPASATFLLYAPPSRQSRQLVVRVHMRSVGYGNPRAVAAGSLLAPDA